MRIPEREWIDTKWTPAWLFNAAATLVLAHLREVDPATLADLKRQLRGFDAQRKVWGKRSKRPKVVPIERTQEMIDDAKPFEDARTAPSLDEHNYAEREEGGA